FQAEDGIRDRNVTGVQTCALPISSQALPEGNAGTTAMSFVVTSPAAVPGGFTVAYSSANITASGSDYTVVGSALTFVGNAGETRSEERRVGKECRTRRLGVDCDEE